MLLPSKLEYVDCPVCNQGGFSNCKVALKLNGWNIVKCSSCGFCFVNPRLKEKLIIEGYDNKNEFASQIHCTADLYEYYQDYHDGTKLGNFKRILDNIERLTGKGRMLDFGCGTGTFLKIAKENGWNVFGLEVGSWAKKSAEEIGFDLFVGTLEEARYPNELFDVVFCSSVLEHLWNPLKELKEINRILRANGLFVATGIPNFNSFSIIIKRDSFKSNKPLGHLNYFTPKTLKILIEKAGFKVIRLDSFGFNYEDVFGRQILNEKNRMAGRNNVHQKESCLKGVLKIFCRQIFSKMGIGTTLEVYAKKPYRREATG